MGRSWLIEFGELEYQKKHGFELVWYWLDGFGHIFLLIIIIFNFVVE